MSRMTRPDDHFIDLIKRSGSADKTEALNAQHELAIAIETPLRKGVLKTHRLKKPDMPYGRFRSIWEVFLQHMLVI